MTADLPELYLDHVLIGVRDLDVAGRTFAERLGFKVTPEGRHPGRGTHNRLVVFGPDYLEFLAIHNRAQELFRPNLATFLETREGLFIFAMGTRDIEASVARLRDIGGVVDDVVHGERKSGDGTAGYSWRQAEIDRDATTGSQTFFIQHDKTVAERYSEPPDPGRSPQRRDRARQARAGGRGRRCRSVGVATAFWTAAAFRGRS